MNTLITNKIIANIKGIEILLRFNGLGNIVEVKEMRPEPILSHLSFKDYHMFSNFGFSDYDGWVKCVLTIRRENLKNIEFIDENDDFESLVLKYSKIEEYKKYISLVVIDLVDYKSKEDKECYMCKWFSNFYKVPSLSTSTSLTKYYYSDICDVWLHLYIFDSLIVNNEEINLLNLNICTELEVNEDELIDIDLNLGFNINNIYISRNDYILFKNQMIDKNKIYKFKDLIICHNVYKKSKYVID